MLQTTTSINDFQKISTLLKKDKVSSSVHFNAQYFKIKNLHYGAAVYTTKKEKNYDI